MPEIKVTPLGAGQDVGRSCLLLSMGGKNIMLDCGMHMGFNDERRFPDFSYIVPEGPLTSHIDCVIISHFHLDNCGALPYMSEIIGFNGPIYMTPPTKAIVPILFEGLRKINNLEEKGKRTHFSTHVIKNCMKKVTAIDLNETIMVDNELEIKTYYAGHVLGAAMFRIKVGSQSVVYTGDFNMNPDRHLGAASIDKCQPDLLITESMYATADPSPKPCRKRDFLRKVGDCMLQGGKVLIPVFLFGRSQEICILLDTFWEEHNFSYPIYFASDSMTMKANSFYKTFAKWTNPKIYNSGNTNSSVFEFKHVKAFDRSNIDDAGPMVVLATDGMLQLGLSREIFKKWAHDEKNLLILPDRCDKGTLGYKILSGVREFDFGSGDSVKMEMKVMQMNFNAVADTKEIIQLIENCAPKNVLLTHRHEDCLQPLLEQIKEVAQMKCFMLSGGVTFSIDTRLQMPTNEAVDSMKSGHVICHARGPRPTPIKRNIHFTVHVAEENRIILINFLEACKENVAIQQNFLYCARFEFENTEEHFRLEDKLFRMFKGKLQEWNVLMDENFKISVESVNIEVISDGNNSEKQKISVSWNNHDEDIALYVLEVLYSFG